MQILESLVYDRPNTVEFAYEAASFIGYLECVDDAIRTEVVTKSVVTEGFFDGFISVIKSILDKLLNLLDWLKEKLTSGKKESSDPSTDAKVQRETIILRNVKYDLGSVDEVVRNCPYTGPAISEKNIFARGFFTNYAREICDKLIGNINHIDFKGREVIDQYGAYKKDLSEIIECLDKSEPGTVFGTQVEMRSNYIFQTYNECSNEFKNSANKKGYREILPSDKFWDDMKKDVLDLKSIVGARKRAVDKLKNTDLQEEDMKKLVSIVSLFSTSATKMATMLSQTQDYYKQLEKQMDSFFKTLMTKIEAEATRVE